MKTFKSLILITAIMVSTKVMTMTTGDSMLFAWINNANEIEIITNSPTSFKAQDLQITDALNKIYKFTLVNQTSDSFTLKTTESINNASSIVIKTNSQKIYGYYSLDYVATHFDYKGPLGAELSDSKTSAVFRLWSPSAESVTVILMDKVTHKIISSKLLTKKENGLWEGVVKEDFILGGIRYQYKVKAFGEIFTALDPYAKAMESFNPKAGDETGFGIIVGGIKTSPYTPPTTQKDDANFIGMEIHVRDATISPNSPAPANLKGTYLGFISALDYFKSLGITHIQILPLQNFYSVDESKKTYQGVDTPKSEINYNWGYDPHNYFTPSGWYSTDSNHPTARINELQQMTNEIHKRKMGIILDVVYNHVYSGSAFEASAPGMYLRRNRRGEVSTTSGAGASLESRSVMVRRLIVDSLKYWQDTFHIDGFRFDLMGFLDKETMAAVRSTLHPQTILYGEAWNFTDLPDHEATVKTDLPHELNLSAFNDTSRDSYAGRNEGRGFIQGHFYDNNKVRSGIVGGIKNHPQTDMISQDAYDSFAENPVETLNFLTIHDGFTLWDKINLSMGGDRASRVQAAKNAYALLFTSQGRVVFQQGCEAGRSKPLYGNDPYPERAYTSDITVPENGIKYFHENSYSSSDATNRFDWDRAREFSEIKNYVSGLSAMRKAIPELHLEDSATIQNDLKFYPQYMNGVIAYTIGNNVIVVHNGEKFSQSIKFDLLKNPLEWKILMDCKTAGVSSLYSDFVKLVPGLLIIDGKCSTLLQRK